MCIMSKGVCTAHLAVLTQFHWLSESHSSQMRLKFSTFVVHLEMKGCSSFISWLWRCRGKQTSAETALCQSLAKNQAQDEATRGG